MIASIDHYTPYQFPESGKYLSDMAAVQDEYFAAIVNGELEVIAGLEEFWDNWHAAGGEQYMREMSDQFDAWIAEHPEWRDPEAILAPDSWNTERKLAPPKA